MKMKNLALFLGAASLLASCQREALRINAQLDNLPDGKVYLSVYDSLFNVVTVDSTQAIDGQFFFESSKPIELAECIIISNREKGLLFYLFAGNDDVEVTGDIEKEMNVEGSYYCDAVKQIGTNMPGLSRLAELQREYQTTTGDIDKRQALKEEMELIQQDQFAYIKQKITANTKTPIGPFLLSNFIRYFSFEEIETFVDSFKVEMPNYKYVKTLSSIIEQSRAEYEAQKAVEIGCVAPDFTLTDNKGNEVKLSQLRGKIVLLDFWASWCLPCRRNNQILRSVYSKFADKNIEIVCVSIDQKSDSWLKAIEEDQLPGIQLIDSTNIISDIYCVNSIPASFLLDENGIIVSKEVNINSLFDNLPTIKQKK